MSILLAAASLAAQSPEALPPPPGIKVQAVRVDEDDSRLRVLPPGERLNGQTYGPLGPAEAANAAAVAKAIVMGPHPSPLLAAQGLTGLPGIYVSMTLANGMQRIHRANGTTDSLPTAAMGCTLAPPVSLGRQDDLAFAFVLVTCPVDDPVWRSFRLGMRLAGNRVTAVALNAGDPPNLFLDPGRERD